MPFPPFDWQREEAVGAATGTSNGTNVTCNASANTKGNYAPLITSTAFPSSLMVLAFDTPSSARSYLVDIAIGAASSEQVLISNLLVSVPSSNPAWGAVGIFPLAIPAGTRIAARAQSTTGSSQIRVSCHLFAGGFGIPPHGAIIDTYGVDTTDSGGTSIDPGGSSHTKGSYVEITGATTRPHRYLAVLFGSQVNGVMTTGTWLFDIAIGGAGSEVVILNNLVVNATSQADGVHPAMYPLLPVNIPAGTRIAARAQSSITDATDRLLDMTILGF
jgi:hypothetical protein